MRLICLNTWGGRLYYPLVSFLGRFQETTDIFCFQEVFDMKDDSSKVPTAFGIVPDLYERLAKQLNGFRGYLSKPYSSFEERLTTFVKSTIVSGHGDIPLCDQKEIEVDKKKGSVGSRLQWVTVKQHDKAFTIANVHGIWLPDGKSDTTERIEQSERIAGFLEARKGPKILCGDFNLLPETRSIGILEKLSMRNLIKEYGIVSTRSSHYVSGEEKFADYVFVSPLVTVRDFKVLEEEISDHLALFLEFC